MTARVHNQNNENDVNASKSSSNVSDDVQASEVEKEEYKKEILMEIERTQAEIASGVLTFENDKLGLGEFEKEMVRMLEDALAGIASGVQISEKEIKAFREIVRGRIDTANRKKQWAILGRLRASFLFFLIFDIFLFKLFPFLQTGWTVICILALEFIFMVLFAVKCEIKKIKLMFYRPLDG